MALRRWLFSFSQGSCCFSIFSGSPWHCFRPCVRGTLDRITMTEAKCWPARIEDCLFTEDPEQKHGCYIVQGCLGKKKKRSAAVGGDFQELKLFLGCCLIVLSWLLWDLANSCCLGIFLSAVPWLGKILDGCKQTNKQTVFIYCFQVVPSWILSREKALC